MTDKIESSEGPKCPYCGHVHRDAADWADVVHFWGTESVPVEYVCNSCDLSFHVNEVVTRHWESEPIVQKAAKSTQGE